MKTYQAPAVYRVGSKLYRTYWGETAQKILAKEIVFLAYDGLEDSIDFDYCGSAWKTLGRDAEILSFNEVRDLGRSSGTCLLCERRLSPKEDGICFRHPIFPHFE